MNNKEEIKKILQLIQNKQIEPSEGLKQIARLKEEASSKEETSFNQEHIEEEIKRILVHILKMDEEELNFEITFKEMGVDSISSVEIVRDLNEIFHINMDGVQLYDYPTIPTLAESILSEIKKNSEVLQGKKTADEKRLNHRYEYINDLVDKFSTKTASHEEKEKTVPELHLKQNVKMNEKKKTAPKLTLGMPQQKKTEEQIEKKISLKMPSEREMSKKNEKNQISSSLEERIKVKLEEKETKASLKKAAIPKLHVTKQEAEKEEIAIIGISGRFPDAKNTREFWKNLRDGVCSIREVPKERYDLEPYYDPDPKAKNKTYCTVAGMLSNIDEFDPLFFNISPKEAAVIEPQQRIFLEEAWKALEDAGCSEEDLKNSRCGVFVGCAPSDYAQNLEQHDMLKTAEGFIGTSSSILASRISYFLNLKGPSMSIDTACSSSLVAIHEACTSIWNGDCDMAISGGIRLMISPDIIIQSSQMEILSPTGICRPFDNAADGTVLSEGAAVLVLKPLSRAKEDKDYIYGVIQGSGVNQDGKTNGITAPSVISQTNLEKDVYRKFSINPENITYVETHGTGTKLGDPIEVKALTEAFQTFTAKQNYCALGSVKANIGHTTMAAGAVSVIKVLLAMKNKKIPPLISYQELNENIKLSQSPFYINQELINWDVPEGIPRTAAISAFGFSGTNCHMVIREYCEK